LVEAARRFPLRMFPASRPQKNGTLWTQSSELAADENYQGQIEVVEVVMNNDRGCAEKYPSMNMDEQCEWKENFFKPSGVL